MAYRILLGERFQVNPPFLHASVTLSRGRSQAGEREAAKTSLHKAGASAAPGGLPFEEEVLPGQNVVGELALRSDVHQIAIVTTPLDRFTQPRNELAIPGPGGKLQCVACAHRCKLADGARGVCQVRFREGESLRIPWGYTAGVAVDPIEKKPFFHLLPGAKALSFGMLGCDMKCSYCQNWFTSQAIRDPRASQEAVPTSPEALIAAAKRYGCPVITSTYNEPLITAEWAHDVFTLAKEEGIWGTFVSNGHATPQVLDYLGDVLTGYKVDLKSFREESYRRLGGKLAAVKETIQLLWERGVWCEVVTLVVPGFNDSDQELAAIAEFLASVSPEIPWHVTAFHPDYQMTASPRTPVPTLLRAAVLGKQAGLQFVYAGNLPGQVKDLENTNCPSCGRLLVARLGFQVLQNQLGEDGHCPFCQTRVPGRWATPVLTQKFLS